MINSNLSLSSVAIVKTLSGQYSLVGQSLRSTDKTLYIKSRKPEKVTKKKPSKFLILTKPSFEYISSMYPVEPDKYLIEYGKSAYEVSLSDSEANIEPVSLKRFKEFVNERSGESVKDTQGEYSGVAE